ncbi:hypothetical protein [Mycobacterium neglectum]|uniref:hypothetical protein n=1 Tax=Mycobacterium neglectum TaxID=242737 RepID=UPI000BFEE91D|nr:hypothetical protein [Mycobacterium neglectum]
MSSQCRDCAAGVEHCHGAVVHHALGRNECTEADCPTLDAVHAFSIDCDAIGCNCDVLIAQAI